VLFAALLLGGPSATPRQKARPEESATGPYAAHAHVHTMEDLVEDWHCLLQHAADGKALAALFEKAPDEQARAELVVRALAVDARAGVGLTLRFISKDPPLFFRQTVVDKLEEATGEPSGFDVAEPFRAAGNREAAAKLAAKHGLQAP